jgi:hypothetical protein
MITRRATLAAGALVAAASGLPVSAASLGTNGGRAAALVAALRYPASAVAVGRAYLKAFPMDADAERLSDAIITDNTIRRRLETHLSDPDELALAIAEAVRADFINRRTVKLDGWVVAQTEARLCALAALV